MQRFGNDNTKDLPDLDPDDRRPKWQQIAAVLAEAMDRGEIKQGRPLPIVATLALRYEAGTATVWRALVALREAGMVRGQQGIGVFATGQPAPADAPWTAARNATVPTPRRPQ